jgi:N-acetylgalactosamine-6-sulfatase
MPQTRRDFFRSVAGAACVAQPAGAQRRPPNIVFILTDDLGWGDLGCYGNRNIRTPNVDRLAQQGTRFKQFYTASAVCSPSRASFLTGRFTARHGLHSHLRELAANRKRGLPDFLDPNQPLMPRILKEAGYVTAHFGKWHLTSSDDTAAPRPPAYGFDAHKVVVDNGDGLERLPLGTPGWNVWKEAMPGLDWHEFKSRSSELVIDETIRFVEQNRNGPFFIDTWLFDPHAQLTPTAQQMAPYKDWGAPFRIYYGAVTNLDAQIGRLLRKLDESGLAENTIVLFSSDNGPEDIHVDNAQEHGVGNPGPVRGRKRSGYEGGIRLPFIVRWPGHTPAGRYDQETIFGAVDFLPTLCRIAGAKLPPESEIDGLDMRVALEGTSIERTRPLYWDLRENNIGDFINQSPKLVIREGRWKLLMENDGSGVELYDIVKNPLEVDNLADTHPDVASRLARRLAAWKENPATR